MEIKDFYVNNNTFSFDIVDNDDELKISYMSKTAKNYEELLSYGIDAFTSGNHIWDKREIFNYYFIII